MRWLSPFSPRITVINGSETKKKSMASFSSADILRTGTTTRALQLKMFKKKKDIDIFARNGKVFRVTQLSRDSSLTRTHNRRFLTVVNEIVTYPGFPPL